MIFVVFYLRYAEVYFCCREDLYGACGNAMHC